MGGISLIFLVSELSSSAGPASVDVIIGGVVVFFVALAAAVIVIIVATTYWLKR